MPLSRAIPALRPTRRGFTIMEAVAAVVLLAIAMPPMLWGLRQSHAHRSTQVLTSRARWLASERLEDIIADRYSPDRGYAYLAPFNYPAEPSIPGFESMSRAVVIAETGADLLTPGPGYKRITCTVTFTDAAGRPRSLDLTTVLTSLEP